MQVESGRLRVVAPTERREEPFEEPELGVAPTPPSPGRYIREQRQRRGMSLEQLAAATKIPRTSLAVLEEDRHEELPGAVFVKGFLRCCARALEVDPDVVMELLYERERAALQARRRERPQTLVPTTGPATPATPVAPSEPESRRPAKSKRARGSAPSTPVALHRVLARLPSPATLLWVVVAALVAMVLMAAFNLIGGPGSGVST